MALILRGKTPCGLCGAVMGDEDALVAFPAFLRPHHPLARFSDAAFHERCFGACPERDEVDVAYRRFREIWDSRPLDLKTESERNAWAQEAFREFDGPPPPR